MVAAWTREEEEEKVSENRQSKKQAEETDKVEVAPDAGGGGDHTNRELERRFRVIMVGPTQALPTSGVGCAERETREP